MNIGPLSFWIDLGNPNRETSPLFKVFITLLALSVLQAKASIHQVNLPTNTKRYLNPPGTTGVTVNTACQSSPGTVCWV